MNNNQMNQVLARNLPLVPGYTFNFNVGADRFHKPQHWKLAQGIPVLADRDCPRPKPGIGGIDLPSWAAKSHVPTATLYTGGQGEKVPAWVAFDKQVLSFNAYYQEPIPESPLENYRVHNCRILYYLEDDTMQVLEPRTLDAGAPQGQIIRRHRISLPPPADNQFNFYTLDHLNVGCEVELYGKIFFIYGCDGFTRKFLNRIGISVPQNLEPPLDLGTEKLKDMKMSQAPKKPQAMADTRGKFLLHDKHVLRFWAYWDDRCNEFGDLRQFVVRYFLSDDTIEIREIIRPNSGYESFPLFLRRSRLPKTTNRLVSLPGESTPLTILNVLGSIHGTKNKKAHYMVDHLAPGTDERGVEYYMDRDLAIGSVINSFGRSFILTDCDEFTKRYYREKYKINEFTPLVLNEPVAERPKPEIPPYNGWGTDEDSLQSWKSLEPKAPISKNYQKIVEMEKDILRFAAKLHKPKQKVNDERNFTIIYYMADDSIQVFEQEHPNAGFPKGSFLHRSKVRKSQEEYPTEFGKPPVYYTFEDFYTGNILNLNGFKFHLTSADEFTLSYMEAHKNQFPVSNLDVCLDKAREAFGPLVAEDVLKLFSEYDSNLQGVMDYPLFRKLLVQISKCGLSEHEIITLSRAFRVETPEPGTDFQTLQAIVQTELRRFNFDKPLLERIEYTLRHHDPCRSGKVDRATLRATLKGSKIPLFKDLLDFLIEKWPSADGENVKCNRVDYCSFLKYLDWEANPAPVAKPASTCCVMRWVEPKPPMKIFCVNYRAFLELVIRDFKFALPSVCCKCNQKPCTCENKGMTNGSNECNRQPEMTESRNLQGQGDGQHFIPIQAKPNNSNCENGDANQYAPAEPTNELNGNLGEIDNMNECTSQYNLNQANIPF